MIDGGVSRLPPLETEALATAQREYGPDFSPQHEFHRPFQPVFSYFSRGIGAYGDTGARARAILYAAEYFP